MRFLITASMSAEVGNQLIKQGKLAPSIQAALETIKPEAAYFGLKDGKRTAHFIVNMQEASDLPAVAEPLFFIFGGSVECVPVMVPQDLMKAGPAIEAAAKKFGS